MPNTFLLEEMDEENGGGDQTVDPGSSDSGCQNRGVDNVIIVADNGSGR